MPSTTCGRRSRPSSARAPRETPFRRSTTRHPVRSLLRARAYRNRARPKRVDRCSRPTRQALSIRRASLARRRLLLRNSLRNLQSVNFRALGRGTAPDARQAKPKIAVVHGRLLANVRVARLANARVFFLAPQAHRPAAFALGRPFEALGARERGVYFGAAIAGSKVISPTAIH